MRERGRVEVGEPLREAARAARCRCAAAPRARPREREHRLEVDALRARARARRAARSCASRTGCMSGRSSRQSSAVTRWIVPRMTPMRTTSRRSSSSDTDSGRKPSSRDQSAVYGLCGTCACIPTRCSTASSGVRSERWSSSWRSSVARFSARRLRTGSGKEPPRRRRVRPASQLNYERVSPRMTCPTDEFSRSRGLEAVRASTASEAGPN